MVADGVREWCLPGPAPHRADRRCSGSDPAGQRLPQRGEGRGGGKSRFLVARLPTPAVLRCAEHGTISWDEVKAGLGRERGRFDVRLRATFAEILSESRPAVDRAKRGRP